jgi:hypothetical protein
VLLALGVALSAACAGGKHELALPAAGAAQARYGDDVAAAMNGNVLELEIPLSAELLRGGEIWERGAPYLYLFSTATRDLFTEYPGLAAVRATALAPDGKVVATALLLRETLTETRWKHAIALAAVAQQQGTTRPRALEELIYWGDDHTEHEYRNRRAAP